MNVVSLNINILGHKTYALTLERVAREFFPEVSWKTVRLMNDSEDHDSFGELVFSLGTRRLPGCSANDRDYYRLRAEMIISWLGARKLKRILGSYRPDVFHIHTRTVGLWIGDMLPEVPFVIDTDTTTAALVRHRGAEVEASYRPLIALEKRAFHQAQRIVAWSIDAKRSLMEDYGIKEEKITVLPVTIPENSFPWPIRRERQPGALVKILFVGNEVRRKGLYDLYEVLQKHLRDRCELMVVTREKLEFGESAGVTIRNDVGPLSPELARIYEEADILVMTSHEDTQPIALVEGIAVGLPVVSSFGLGIPDIVEHGVNGYLVKAGDLDALRAALEKLAGDPLLREKMGLAGRRRYEENFMASRNMGRMMEVFKEAIQDKRKDG